MSRNSVNRVHGLPCYLQNWQCDWGEREQKPGSAAVQGWAECRVASACVRETAWAWGRGEAFYC